MPSSNTYRFIPRNGVFIIHSFFSKGKQLIIRQSLSDISRRLSTSCAHASERVPAMFRGPLEA